MAPTYIEIAVFYTRRGQRVQKAAISLHIVLRQIDKRGRELFSHLARKPGRTSIFGMMPCRSPVDAALYLYCLQIAAACGLRGRRLLKNPGRPPASQRPAERLVQQRLLQLIERGELALVEGFETLGFQLQFGDD